jgi:HEAT repeat protein
MYKDPELPTPRVELFLPEKTKDLWLRALVRPEADWKCKAADAIAKAHRRGVKGLETAVGPLVAALDRPDQHPAVRLAAARALVELDARDAAESLFRQAQAGDADLRDLAEPALARWDYRPARAAWLDRLRDPETPRRSLILAMQGLAAVEDGQAADRLREIALSDRVADPVRLEAARALGLLGGDGVDEAAERLAADDSPRGLPSRLAAASLLRRRRSDAAVRVLRGLAEDTEPAVAALAVVRLIEIDPDLVLSAIYRPHAKLDANLWSLTVEALRLRPTKENIGRLADRLDDDPDVRAKARRSLEELAADKAWRDPVLQEAMRILAAKEWRGQEQAAILLTRLDHKPAARRLVELLPSNRPEVCVAAAWGLRKLDVPETLPDVLHYLEATLGRLRAANGASDRKEVPAEILDHQLSQLNQFLGRQKYAPADEALRRFLPRLEGPRQPVAYPESRAAAAWAAGLLHEGKPDDALVTALTERLDDVATVPPEDDRVRRMAAVALGRLGAKESLPRLRAWFSDHEPSFDPVNNACGWAVGRLTGEATPPPKTVRKPLREPSLAPDE